MVRMGLMAATHPSVQALHMDALCDQRLNADKHALEGKGGMQSSLASSTRCLETKRSGMISHEHRTDLI